MNSETSNTSLVVSILFSVAVALALTSCARPQYEEPSPAGSPAAASKSGASGIAFANSALQATLIWDVIPTEVAYGSFDIIITTRTTLPMLADVDGDLAVVLWMPSMGHGSNPVVVTRVSQGRYRAEKVFFSMKGDWDIRFEVKKEGQVRDTAVHSILL